MIIKIDHKYLKHDVLRQHTLPVLVQFFTNIFKQVADINSIIKDSVDDLINAGFDIDVVEFVNYLDSVYTQSVIGPNDSYRFFNIDTPDEFIIIDENFVIHWNASRTVRYIIRVKAELPDEILYEGMQELGVYDYDTLAIKQLCIDTINSYTEEFLDTASFDYYLKTTLSNMAQWLTEKGHILPDENTDTLQLENIIERLSLSIYNVVPMMYKRHKLIDVYPYMETDNNLCLLIG